MEGERDFLCAMGRRQHEGATVIALDDDAGAQPGCPAPMQWQFPAKPGGVAPAFVSFRTQDDEAGATKEFSISGFRPPAGGGDAINGIKKHAASSSLAAASYQRRQFGFDAQQYGGHRAPGLVDHRGASTHHPLGGSRMVQPLSSRRPVLFNQANPAYPVPVRAQSLHNAAASGGALFKSHQPPFAMSNGFGGSTVGAYGARNPRSQNSTQLTIFYNGTVNVFDNVSVEKAQELMMLASKASISSPAPIASPPNVGSVRKPDSPVSAPAKINVPEAVPARQVVTHKPELSSATHLASASSPISTVPQSVALPAGGTSNCATDFTGPKAVVQPPPVVVPTSQASSSQATPLATTSAATAMARAVPQARKASLARFLERRKERVTSVEPYPTSKSLLESSDTKGSANALSKSSSFGITQTSSSDREPLRFGQPRNISFGGEVCPSTKLQI